MPPLGFCVRRRFVESAPAPDGWWRTVCLSMEVDCSNWRLSSTPLAERSRVPFPADKGMHGLCGRY